MAGKVVPVATAVAAPAVAVVAAPAVAVTTSVQALPAPAVANSVAVGLAVLQDAQGFYIRQKAQWFEEITGFEKANKYEVMLKPKGVTGLTDPQIAQLPKVFQALERSECFERQFCRPAHSFGIDIFDVQNQLILQTNHPNSCMDMTFECFCVGAKCCPSRMEVRTPGGDSLGRSENSFRTFKCTKDTWVDVYDQTGNHKFTFEAACCQFGPNCICRTYVFNIHEGKDTSKPPVGVLKNVFPGCNLKGMCSKADNLELEWFRDMTIDEKSMLLAAAFHIDFLVFEKPDDGDDNGGGGLIGMAMAAGGPEGNEIGPKQ